MEKVKDKFMQGVAALILSQVMIKILGVIYSIYLTNKRGFGDSGNAIYMSGYQIYTLLLSLSSIGIPNAISKLVSEKIAFKDYKGADRVFKIALVLFAGIGFFSSIILFLSSNYISNKMIQIPEAEYTLKALSPAIFFVSISSVIRGYCNGKNEIKTTAKSQIVEQIFKCLFTIIFVEIINVISKFNTRLMAAIANFATTMATLTSFIYIFIKIKQSRNANIYNINKQYFKKEKIKIIIRKIFSVSIPMTISSILSTAGKNIDSITIVRILKNKIGETEAKIKYGILSSKVDLILNMPLAFNIAFSTALVPEIASSLIKNDFENINKKIKYSLLITILIGLPCTFGIFVYSKEILVLLFPNACRGANLLRMGSIMIIFSLLTQTVNGALQGIGKNKIPVKALFVGIIVKFVCNIILIPIENIYENGAVIGNVFSNIISFFIVYYNLRKTIVLEFSLLKLIIKPTIVCFIMTLSSYNIYMFLKNNFSSEYISIIIGIISAIIIYIIFIFLFKIFSEEEIKMLPKGDYLINFLKKTKIY